MKRKPCARDLRHPAPHASTATRAFARLSLAVAAALAWLGSVLGIGASLALPLLGTGCIKKAYVPETCDRPDLSGCIIDREKVIGAREVPASDVKKKIATVETDHGYIGTAVEHVPILSLYDRLTVDYERLDPFVLERDLARVERYYRSRGYYEARAHAARVMKHGKVVHVEIVVDEGEPVKLVRVEISWKDENAPNPGEPSFIAAHTTLQSNLKTGTIFDEQAFEEAKKKAVRALTDVGYAYANIDAKADVDLIKHTAVARFVVEAGPRCTFGKISIEGLGELPEKPMRRGLGIHEGRPFSTIDIENAQTTLGKFGVLASIDVVIGTAPKDKPKDKVVPVTFRVRPSPLKTLRVGGGLEVGSRFEVHGLLGWEHRNFLGGLRQFKVEVKPGFVLNPQTLQTFFDKDTWEATRALPEVRLKAELKQPGFIERRTDGILNAAVNIYVPTTAVGGNTAAKQLELEDLGAYGKVLPPKPAKDEDSNDYVLGYLEFAGKAGVERTFWQQRAYVGLFANIQHDRPFSYRPTFGAAIPGFDPITIPYLEAIGTIDLRYGASGRLDPVNPHKGAHLSVDLQAATPFTGGKTYADFRVRPEVRGYIPLARKWTIALRGAMGFLFPTNYDEGTLDPDNCKGDQCGAITQLFQFRAFFSGGSSSNRGYPFAGVGPHGKLTLKDASGHEGTIITAGGLSMWEASVELRAPLIDKLGITFFVDGSNIGRSRSELFTAKVIEEGDKTSSCEINGVKIFGVKCVYVFAPHLSAGLGVRYETPVGPLRADFGFRIPCAQALTSRCSLKEYMPDSVGQAGYLFGLPLAISIAIGEAF